METITRPNNGDVPRSANSDDREAFLEFLKQEHARFLDSFRQACSLLDRRSGQLAQIAATHGRLTRQLFDAQRSILKRRADVDAEVARIGRAADDDATSIVEAARIEVLLGDVIAPCIDEARLVNAKGSGDLGACGSASARPEVTSLAMAVVRTTAEADSLAGVIDDALEPAEHDGAALQLALGTLLDDWWDAERQEGADVIDLARARAAVRAHVARIQADEILVDARDQVGKSTPTWSFAPPVGPPQVLVIAERGAAESVQTRLDMLAKSLDPGRRPCLQRVPPTGGHSDARLERTSAVVPDEERDPSDDLRYFLSGRSVPSFAMQVRHVGR